MSKLFHAFNRFTRRSNRIRSAPVRCVLKLELMEDRLTPAHFVVQSENVTGSGTASAADGGGTTDGPNSLTLTESPDGSGGNEWSGQCNANVVSNSSGSSITFDDNLDPGDMEEFSPDTTVNVSAQTGLESFGYIPSASATATLSVTIVFQIAPDNGEANGTAVTLSSLEDFGGDINPGWSLSGTNGIIFSSLSSEFGSAQVQIGSTITFTDKTQFTENATTASQDLNTFAAFQPDFTLESAAPLQVSTPDTQTQSGSVFGPYIAGVPLSVPFTVNDSTGTATSVHWVVGGQGGASGIARNTGHGVWSFTKEVQKLASGPHTLTVTADNASGVVGTFTGTLNVVSTPLSIDDADAATNNHGTLGTSIDLSDLHFISGISLSETFTGTITNLPYYYQTSVLQIPVFGSARVTPENVNGNLGFQVTANVGSLAAKTQNIMPTIGGSALSTFGAQDQTFSVLTEPAWLKTPGKTPTFDYTNYDYDFTRIDLKAATLSIPAVKTGIEWLDDEVADKKFTTSASLTPNLNVEIPIVLDGTPLITVNSLTANATALGVKIWQTTYTNSSVTATIQLNSQTLEPTDLQLLLNDTPEELASGTLFSKKVTVSVSTPLTPVVTVTASLALNLAGSLTVNGAGLELTWANNQLEWVPPTDSSNATNGTFINLNATVTGTVTGEATAKVAGGWLGSPTASLSLTATLSITGQAGLGGFISDPKLISPSLTGSLSGSYVYSLSGEEEDDKQKVNMQNQPDGTFGPVTLFDL